ILRFAAGRVLAFVMTLVFLLSPLQIANLPGLRDFIKGPFFFALLIIILILARKGAQAWVAIVCAISAGLLFGIGIGFRPDLLIMVPLLVAALLLSRPKLRVALIAIALAIAAFIASAWPIISVEQPLPFGYFVLNHGLMDPFEHLLGVRADDYSRGYIYHDHYNARTSIAYGKRTT